MCCVCGVPLLSAMLLAVALYLYISRVSLSRKNPLTCFGLLYYCVMTGRREFCLPWNKNTALPNWDVAVFVFFFLYYYFFIFFCAYSMCDVNAWTRKGFNRSCTRFFCHILTWKLATSSSANKWRELNGLKKNEIKNLNEQKKFWNRKTKTKKKRRNSFTHICNTRNVMSNSIVFLFVFFYLNYRVYFSSFLCLCIFKEKAKPSLSFLLCHKVCSPLYLSALLAKWFRFSMSLDLFIQNW